jgi:hypothetical protein
MQIYSADAALRAEDAVWPSPSQGGAAERGWRNLPSTETSVAHFCAFVDFYTRKTTDPLNTALACEKHAEILDIAPHDATPENMRLLVDTMLEVIDHLEKKWLDEQIRHEERMLKHREDVARLYRQIRELQPKPAKRAQMYQRGAHWFRNVVSKHVLPPAPSTRKSTSRRAEKAPAPDAPMLNTAA